MSPVAESDSQIESIPALGGRSRRFWRLAFSFPAMLSALLVVLAVTTARPRLNDPHLWWHLKTGEIIWNTHQIPRTALFSFPTNNHTWIPPPPPFHDTLTFPSEPRPTPLPL